MIYEYECQTPGSNHGIFEATQKITDEPLTECPKCIEEGKESQVPKKLISLSAFALKGGGWSDSGYSNK